jgi:hypothetical protein
MIGHRYRAVANPRREELDQEGRNRPLHHRDKDHQVERLDGRRHGICRGKFRQGTVRSRAASH